MHYEKPIVMDLNARPADGQEPLLCYPGAQAGGTREVCVGGGAPAFHSCQMGNGDQDCAGGLSAYDQGMDCYSGGNAGWCEAGGTVVENDPYGCRVGPSVTP